MKTISIHTDIRDSKSLDFEAKKSIYNDLYTIFSRVANLEFDNMSFYKNDYVGDGVISTFRIDKLSNQEEIIALLSDIDKRARKLEGKYEGLQLGSGVSYGLTFDWGNNHLISFSIDGASTGANLASKHIIKDEIRPWVMPLKVADDGDGSINELKNMIETSDAIWSKESCKHKNLWFSFNE